MQALQTWVLHNARNIDRRKVLSEIIQSAIVCTEHRLSCIDTGILRNPMIAFWFGVLYQEHGQFLKAERMLDCVIKRVESNGLKR